MCKLPWSVPLSMYTLGTVLCFNEVGLAVAKSIEQICYGFSIPVQPSPYYWLFLPFGSLFICLYIVLIYSLSAHDAVVSISNFYHKESGTSQISTGEISI